MCVNCHGLIVLVDCMDSWHKPVIEAHATGVGDLDRTKWFGHNKKGLKCQRQFFESSSLGRSLFRDTRRVPEVIFHNLAPCRQYSFDVAVCLQIWLGYRPDVARRWRMSRRVYQLPSAFIANNMYSCGSDAVCLCLSFQTAFSSGTSSSFWTSQTRSHSVSRQVSVIRGNTT